MNTNVVLGIVLIIAIIAATQILKSLCNKIISLLQQESETAVAEAFGKGWDAAMLATRSAISETKTTRVSRSLP